MSDEDYLSRMQSLNVSQKDLMKKISNLLRNPLSATGEREQMLKHEDIAVGYGVRAAVEIPKGTWVAECKGDICSLMAGPVVVNLSL